MKRALAALVLLSLSLSAVSPLRAESLDGTKWKTHPKSTIRKVLSTMAFWHSNKLAFDGGQFTKGKGKPVAYTVADENGKTTWKAERTGTKGEKIAWAGVVDGDKMTGTTTITKKDGKIKTYEWKACKCAPKKDKSAPAKAH
jgi:hypothetical protein